MKRNNQQTGSHEGARSSESTRPEPAAFRALNATLRTILRQKLKALALYETYLERCEQAEDHERESLITALKQDDMRHVDLVLAELARVVQKGDY